MLLLYKSLVCGTIRAMALLQHALQRLVLECYEKIPHIKFSVKGLVLLLFTLRKMKYDGGSTKEHLFTC